MVMTETGIWDDAARAVTALAVGTAVLSLFWLVGQRPRRNADVLFAVVSGSMAISLLRPWVADAPAWLHWAMLVGGSVTCNGFWLVSRALFRGDAGVGRIHVAIAAGVAALIVACRAPGIGPGGPGPIWATGLGGLLEFASAALLSLSFLEALRGWGTLPSRSDRQRRAVFMATFAATVLSVTWVSELVAQGLLDRSAQRIAVGAGAFAMLLVTQWLLAHHRRVQPVRPESAAAAPAPSAEDLKLADALRRQVAVMQVYREPELKVATLAARLGTAEHRLSRVITQVLGEKNFNQWINRHRIEHACRLLCESRARSILEISGDSGFASLGPFNRAFKAATGCTPSAWRARQADAGQGREVPVGPGFVVSRKS